MPPFTPSTQKCRPGFTLDGTLRNVIAFHFYFPALQGPETLVFAAFLIGAKHKIVKYKSNYPEKIYHLPEVISKSRVAILRDALAYYKVTIPFDETLLRECPLSSVAQTYLETCRISKRINSKALELIKAGIV